MMNWFGWRSSARYFTLLHGEHKGVWRVLGEHSDHVGRSSGSWRLCNRRFQYDLHIGFVRLLVLVGNGALDRILGGSNYLHGNLQAGLTIFLFRLDGRPDFVGSFFVRG